MSSPQIEDDVVKALRRSKLLHGEIPGHPIVKTDTGKTLDGNHRSEAGFKNVVTVHIASEVDFWEKRWALVTAQRRSTMSEQAEIVSQLCGALEGSGMERSKIASYVVRNEVQNGGNFKQSYMYALIPNKYKQERPSRDFQSPEKSSDELPESFFVKNPDSGEPAPELYTCGKCGFRAPLVGHVLQA